MIVLLFEFAVYLEVMLNSADRLREYTLLEPEAPLAMPGDEALRAKAWPSQGVVKMDQVSFRYRPGTPLVLKSVTFETKGHEKVRQSESFFLLKLIFLTCYTPF